jgi:tetratricopeptide (TPR) repeat protein
MATGPQLVKELNRALNLLHVCEGVDQLDQTEETWSRLGPSQAQATELLLLIAQWVDVGYRDHPILDPLLSRFPVESRPGLRLDGYLRLRLVEGLRALSAEEVDAAVEIFDFVLRAEPGAAGEELLTLAHFWKGRALRKKGEYETALCEIVAARELSQKSRENAMFTAVIHIHEAWLLFQKGMRKEALRLLTEAETTLKATDHTLALGNIESARGRIVRRAGEYAKALEHFDRAIAIYSEGNPNHRNLARTLVNAAAGSTVAQKDRCARTKSEDASQRESANVDSEHAGKPACPLSATLPGSDAAITAGAGDLPAPWPLKRAWRGDCQFRLSPPGWRRY